MSRLPVATPLLARISSATMSAHRQMITTESRGCRAGSEFDDLQLIRDPQNAAISRITVRHGGFVDALEVSYTKQGSTVRRGGSGGGVTVVALEEGEFITKITGVEHGDMKVISKLSMFSNRGRSWGPYGLLGGPGFTWDAGAMVTAGLASHMGLLYFKGSQDSLLRQLTATFAEYPGRATTVAKPTRAVRYESASPVEGKTQFPGHLSKFAQSLMSPVITLVVGDECVEFNAYEDLLCRLPFFQAALRTGFKEASEKKIEMPEDEPEIIAALVEYLYVGAYTYRYNEKSTEIRQTAPFDRNEGSFHLRVHASACKYDCQELSRAAMESLVDILQKLDGMEVVQLLKETYQRSCNTALWEGGKDIDIVKQKLPLLLKRVYVTHSQEMQDIILECPLLANDFLRMSVAAYTG